MSGWFNLLGSEKLVFSPCPPLEFTEGSGVTDTLASQELFGFLPLISQGLGGH